MFYKECCEKKFKKLILTNNDILNYKEKRRITYNFSKFLLSIVFLRDN